MGFHECASASHGKLGVLTWFGSREGRSILEIWRGIDKGKHLVIDLVLDWEQTERAGQCLAGDSVDCFLNIICYTRQLLEDNI